MCLSMQVIGAGAGMTALGVILGLVGFVCCGVNYPIYKRMLEGGKRKYAFEIMELAKKISEEK
mgnify:CR=1 FL=1